MSNNIVQHPSSFRDPSGFVFEKEGVLYRQVNTAFREDFELFLSSGLYDNLVQRQWLVPHERLNENISGLPEYYATLKPEHINFVSYPWEWSFDMLKDAALLTLQLAKFSIKHGMMLKDATPYNIQWHNGKLVFIDTLSFEKYNPAEPWIAYRQFCESFLAPLLLMHYNRQSLQPLLLAYPEGIPLAVAKSLLPSKTKWSLHIYLHIHLHAKIAGNQNKQVRSKNVFSAAKMQNLLTSLELLVKKLKLPLQSTNWSDYYSEAEKRNGYVDKKKIILNSWLNDMPDVKTAADLGANDGEFSKLLSAKNIKTIAADADPYCINRLYAEIKAGSEKKIQPLIIDLSNPSPAVGMNNEERVSFISRLRSDLVIALALIHHLAVGKNIPLEMTAEFFSRVSPWLIIEFVPKEDEKVQQMLSQKKNIYGNYTPDNFEKAFTKYFSIQKKALIEGSVRTVYLMKRNER